MSVSLAKPVSLAKRTTHRADELVRSQPARQGRVSIVKALTLTLASAVMVGTLSTSADAAPRQWSPCKYEDQATRCVWDAKHMGNGEGRSFVVRKGGKVQYVSHARAHRMLAR